MLTRAHDIQVLPGLRPATAVRILGAMGHWSRHRLYIVAVALLLALGIGAWPIHAATMTPVIAPGAAQLQSDHCPGCDADGHAGVHPGLCHTVCGPATLPIADAAAPPSTTEDRLPRDALLPCGLIIGLDPGPPKASILG